jgi:hypothetical protein
VPANKAQDRGDGFRRLNAARPAQKQIQFKGQDADAKNDYGKPKWSMTTRTMAAVFSQPVLSTA